MSKEKIVFWEKGIKSPHTGKYHGDIITDPENIFRAVSTFEFRFVVWDDIPGKKESEYKVPEDVDLERYDQEAWKELADGIVGSESEWALADTNDEIYEVSNCLAFDLGEEKGFFNLGDVETFRAYGYFSNSNKAYATCGDNDTEYEFEVISEYNLDFQEKGPNSTDFTYGGMGNHAILKKVREDEENYLLMHQWSQWAGDELDSGYLLTAEEAIAKLAEHPEIEAIKAWLAETD